MLRAVRRFEIARARRIKRLGFRQPVGGLQQPGEIVEVNGNIRVIGAVGFLVDGEGAAHERLGFGQPISALQQLGRDC